MISSYIDGINPYGSKFVTTGFTIATLVFWIFIMEEKRKWALGLSAACVCVYSLFGTGRTGSMQTLCGWLILVMLSWKDRTFIKTVRPIGIATLGIIVLMGANSLLTKEETQGPDALSVATNMTIIYIAGPLAAFNYAVYHPDEFKGQPSVVFEEVLSALSKSGVIHYTAPHTKGGGTSVNVPFPMNVYTCFDFYYENLGALGCFAAFSLFGAVEGYLFFVAVRGGQVAVLCLTYLGFALMFSPFNDFYSLLPRHMFIVTFAFAYFYLLKRVKVRI